MAARLEVEMKQGGRQTKRLSPSSKLLSRPGPTVEATSYGVLVYTYVTMYPMYLGIPVFHVSTLGPDMSTGIYYGTCILYLAEYSGYQVDLSQLQ